MNNAISRKRARFLYVNDNTLYAQIDNTLCTSKDYGRTWHKHPVNLDGGARSYSKMHARLTRKGVHSAKILKDGKILLVAKQAIYTYDCRKNNMNMPFTVPRGSRPLFICENRDGYLFWGEYFDNPKRDEVSIYVSTDYALSWRVAYTFKKNSIRHVHGVFCDPYDDRIWVTTGDENSESAIWITDDHFKTLKKVIGDSQQSRALQLIFTEDYVYFGTDTPYEKNHIYRINKNTFKIGKLVSVESSVYWGCKVGTHLFFSTVVEPSSINLCDFACIWGSQDGKYWQRITQYKKDSWSMKYFQVGQICFPQGNNNTDYLFYTPVATENEQTLQQIKIANLFDSGLHEG